MKLRFGFILTLLLCITSLNTSIAQQSGSEFNRCILTEQVREIKSTITNEEYELIVCLPYNYDKEAPKKYPTLYFCDGYYDVPHWTGIYGVQFYDKTIKDCIMVGFSYKGENPDYEKLRAHDYTPTDISGTGITGHSEKYLSVIENEFIPFIEKNYRSDPEYRVLSGSSLGGLFTLYAMLTRTDLFKSYIAISPAVQWDNRWLDKLEAFYHNGNKELPVSLFMTVGDKDVLLDPVKKFDEILRGHNYEKFRYQFRILENTYHAGSKSEGYHRGLQFVFEPWLK